MDVWVNLPYATKWQAEQIFKGFFPCQPSASSTNETTSVDGLRKNRPGASRKPSVHARPGVNGEADERARNGVCIRFSLRFC